MDGGNTDLKIWENLVEHFGFSIFVCKIITKIFILLTPGCLCALNVRTKDLTEDAGATACAKKRIHTLLAASIVAEHISGLHGGADGGATPWTDQAYHRHTVVPT